MWKDDILFSPTQFIVISPFAYVKKYLHSTNILLIKVYNLHSITKNCFKLNVTLYFFIHLINSEVWNYKKTLIYNLMYPYSFLLPSYSPSIYLQLLSVGRIFVLKYCFQVYYENTKILCRSMWDEDYNK